MPLRPAIASMSLGRPGVHDLPGKLRQASQYGFEGIEIFFEDIKIFARSNQISILEAASQVQQLCESLRLEVVCLQPFLFYEGLLDRDEHARQVSERLPLWFKIARRLRTDLIQVPSNFLPPDPETGLPRTTGNIDVIVSDLREIADLGLKESPPFRFAYESLAWGNHIDTWEACWDVVCRVDRPNFGICLDTFNIAGRIYADPTSPDGKNPNADADLTVSIARLGHIVDPKKIFFVQVVDGERLSSPLIEGHEFHVPGQPSRMSWSRNARLFAFEEDRGGYLPVVDIARAFFNDVGFRNGWVSLELFSRTLANPDSRTPEEHAKRGIVSWQRLVNALGLEGVASGWSSTQARILTESDGKLEGQSQEKLANSSVGSVSRARSQHL
ncbi:hypothetical protein VTN96DRAFT_9900 [Rasamsonia emersonii]|uniref:3-dehydroshikimate dehydratase n=1 Tax=Rasamsonia emersonii (strain ATCC 16479 / CBS 393.64 / IMI 116815) TaxID=1408163 RepID=A0A0F4YP33_RASE3|nr:3-dehydroshikimate dehydratase [Rasamsonia emersonii CBS 393.64]KKA19388.1 3-dehydroshikimate dehydratase [Rasamsonia emersonii CBS 393.64]